MGVTITQQTVLAFPVEVVSDTSATSLKQLVEVSRQSAQQLRHISSSEMGRLAQAAEYVKVAERWLATAQHFAQSIEGDIRRFTSLKGILGFTEQQLGLDEDKLKALAQLGEVVRGIHSLKQNFESLINTRLRMFKSMKDRAKAGIFNPQADLNDLEEYLRSGIGRSAQEVIATRARLAQFDNELERWTHELELMRAREAALEKQYGETYDFLVKEGALESRPRSVAQDAQGGAVDTNPTGGRVSASADAIKEARETLRWCDGELAKVRKDISDQIAKIEERYKTYHMKFDDTKHGADEVEKTEKAWDDFLSIKDQAALEMLEGYHGDQAPRLTRRRPRR